jgi:hypothetical protein
MSRPIDRTTQVDPDADPGIGAGRGSRQRGGCSKKSDGDAFHGCFPWLGFAYETLLLGALFNFPTNLLRA